MIVVVSLISIGVILVVGNLECWGKVELNNKRLFQERDEILNKLTEKTTEEKYQYISEVIRSSIRRLLCLKVSEGYVLGDFTIYMMTESLHECVIGETGSEIEYLLESGIDEEIIVSSINEHIRKLYNETSKNISKNL
jgi:hypothetical protein